MKILKINGKETKFDPGCLPVTLSELLKKLEIAEATVVAEIDGDIIERSKFAMTQLSDGQAIELVRFVPGG